MAGKKNGSKKQNQKAKTPNKPKKKPNKAKVKFDGPLARGIRTVAGILPYGEKVKQFADFVFSLLVTYQATETDGGATSAAIDSDNDFKSDSLLQFGCGGAFLVCPQMLLTSADNVGVIQATGSKYVSGSYPDFQRILSNYTRGQAQYMSVSAQATAGMTAKGMWGVGIRVITDTTELPELMADVLASGIGLEAVKRCQSYVVGKATHDLRLKKNFSPIDGDAYKPKILDSEGVHPEKWIAAVIIAWDDVNRPIGVAPIQADEFQCVIEIRGGVRLSCLNANTAVAWSNATTDLLHGIDAFITAPRFENPVTYGVQVTDWNKVITPTGGTRRTCLSTKVIYGNKHDGLDGITYSEVLKKKMTDIATVKDSGFPWKRVPVMEETLVECPTCSTWIPALPDSAPTSPMKSLTV